LLNGNGIKNGRSGSPIKFGSHQGRLKNDLCDETAILRSCSDKRNVRAHDHQPLRE
jgi:hypothetical protein